MVFSWDPRKDESNFRKHRITFFEASSVFLDPLSYTYEDVEHSIGEMRYIIIGAMENGKITVVIHTEDNDKIRIISAREATARERRFYEEAHS